LFKKINNKAVLENHLVKSPTRWTAHTHVRAQACMCTCTHACMHTHTDNRFTALRILFRTTRVSWYQKKHSPTHTYHGHQSSLIYFFHLIRSMASSTHTHTVKYCTTMYSAKVKNLPLWLFQKL